MIDSSTVWKDLWVSVAAPRYTRLTGCTRSSIFALVLTLDWSGVDIGEVLFVWDTKGTVVAFREEEGGEVIEEDEVGAVGAEVDEIIALGPEEDNAVAFEAEEKDKVAVFEESELGTKSLFCRRTNFLMLLDLPSIGHSCRRIVRQLVAKSSEN